jgi:hypothetical protein
MAQLPPTSICNRSARFSTSSTIADNYQDSLELIVQACQEAQHLYGYVPKDCD